MLRITVPIYAPLALAVAQHPTGLFQGVRCLQGVLMDSHLVPRWGVQGKVIEVIAGRWP